MGQRRFPIGQRGQFPEVRKTLRNRSRYEDDNNGYYRGLIDERANQTVGTAPRLQITIPGQPEAVSRAVSNRWNTWGETIGLPDDLNLMDIMETRDGEAFAVMRTNPRIPATMPQLDLVVVEGEQVASPLFMPDRFLTDGIRFDEFGNPISFEILDRHPGDVGLMSGNSALYSSQVYDADRVLYFYRRRRASQIRAVPALASSLPLFSQLRRFTTAVIGAAELAASFAAFMTQKGVMGDSGDGDDVEFEPDALPIVRNMINTLPPDADIKAFDPSQPAPSFNEFRGQILTEAGRPICSPENITTGSSAKYNYSSGRLDHLPWQLGIRVRRDRMRRHVLMPLFRAWYEEAKLIYGYLPDGLPDVSTWVLKWRWDAFPSIDPVKDANAADLRIKAGISTYERECGELGENWQDIFDQQSLENKRRAELGLPSYDLSITTTDESGTQQTTVSKSANTDAVDPNAAKAIADGAAVQNTAMNGAQGSVLIDFCSRIVTGEFPADGAEAAIKGCFPAMDRDLISVLVAAFAAHSKKRPQQTTNGSNNANNS